MPAWTSSASTEATGAPSAAGPKLSRPVRPTGSDTRSSSRQSSPGGTGSATATIQRALLHPAFKPLVFILALGPLASLVWGIFANTLGANPAETLIRSTGDWTLRLLLITLAVTPLRQLTGWHALARLRRMLGLFTFFYAALHFLSYAWLDMGLLPVAIVEDVIKRPFILVGMLALLLLIPLAATSFNAAIRRLGPTRWQALHRTVYVIGGLAILHFLWMRAGKNDYGEVAIYAAILAVLLGWRVVRWVRTRRSR